MSALAVNIIIVRPWDVVFPEGKQQGRTIIILKRDAKNI
jgi:hypothetical protein